MKWIRWLLVIFLLAGCSPTSGREQQAVPVDSVGTGALKDLGDAPELANKVWLNTDQALRLEDLRGKVVLIDMWTFG